MWKNLKKIIWRTRSYCSINIKLPELSVELRLISLSREPFCLCVDFDLCYIPDQGSSWNLSIICTRCFKSLFEIIPWVSSFVLWHQLFVMKHLSASSLWFVRTASRKTSISFGDLLLPCLLFRPSRHEAKISDRPCQPAGHAHTKSSRRTNWTQDKKSLMSLISVSDF